MKEPEINVNNPSPADAQLIGNLFTYLGWELMWYLAYPNESCSNREWLAGAVSACTSLGLLTRTRRKEILLLLYTEQKD